MRIGAHESVAGGLFEAFGRGEADGCEALQVFTSYNTRWEPRPLSDEEVSLFRSEAERVGWPLLSHASYLVNLASPDPELFARSVEALHEDHLRCELLGVDFLVVHPGSHVGAGMEAGVARVREALEELGARSSGFSSRILLENTAGPGNCLGAELSQLGRLLDGRGVGGRVGVCIDTCHAHAAGYDLCGDEGYAAFLEELERELGLDTVCAFHLNDAKSARGSRLDRHASVGEGQLGLEPFRRLVNERRFAGRAAVVETPPEPDGSMSFGRNVAVLKGLRGS